MSDKYIPRPLFFTPSKSVAPNLRTWAELRKQINSGAYGSTWTKLLQQAKRDVATEPLTPSSMFPGRLPEQAAHANPDFTICTEVGQRILRNALIFKVTGDKAHKECALKQIYSLFNLSQWPEWRDQAHACQQNPADLRTGMLSSDVGIAYNWLRSSLTQKERQRIVDGIDQCGIQRFLDSLPRKPFWLDRPTNWQTCVVGGLGICGMALGDDHPKSKFLIKLSREKMDSYQKIFGPEGEFNESPGYAGAVGLVVVYYSALQSIEKSTADCLKKFPFPQAARWIQYLTLGPKRLAGFGDCHPEAAPFVAHYAAVADATGDPVIQGLSQQFRAGILGTDTPDIFEIVWGNPDIPAKKPGADYPLHITFKAHGACFSSRTDWKRSGSDCVVYGKAGREPAHAHCDAGQVCIDAHGERLIIDHGVPAGGYPEDFFGKNRTKYYNASVLGHNLLTIDDREHPNRATKGHFLSEGLLPDGLGVHWHYDLKVCHTNASKITRTVFHFLPNIIVVIDDAHAKARADFRLRWHTMKPTKIKDDGTFKFTQGKATLSACVKSYGRSSVAHEFGKHAYRAPYDCNRLGEKLGQPHEPYVDACTKGKSARLLTAFATGPSSSRLATWQEKDGTLSFRDPKRGTFSVRIEKDVLHYETPSGQGSFNLS